MENGNILKKLLTIKKGIVSLGKDARNEYQKYDYVSSSKVLGSIRNLMNDNEVLLIPEIQSAKIGNVGKQILTELNMKMTWVDVESGEILPCLWYSQGADMGEKGPGKAATYSEKMFILKFFNIPTDQDDPDKGNKNQDNSGPIVEPLPEPASDEQLKKIASILMISECGKEVAKAYMVYKGVISDNNARTLPMIDAQEIIDNQDDFLNAVAKWNTQKTEE